MSACDCCQSFSISHIPVSVCGGENANSANQDPTNAETYGAFFTKITWLEDWPMGGDSSGLYGAKGFRKRVFRWIRSGDGTCSSTDTMEYGGIRTTEWNSSWDITTPQWMAGPGAEGRSGTKHQSGSYTAKETRKLHSDGSIEITFEGTFSGRMDTRFPAGSSGPYTWDEVHYWVDVSSVFHPTTLPILTGESGWMTTSSSSWSPDPTTGPNDISNFWGWTGFDEGTPTIKDEGDIDAATSNPTIIYENPAVQIVTHYPTPTCYLKVWFKGGNTYEWMGSGYPCFADPSKSSNAQENVIIGEATGENDCYLEILKWSFLPEYEPDITDPNNPQPNGFPDPTWVAATPPPE